MPASPVDEPERLRRQFRGMALATAALGPALAATSGVSAALLWALDRLRANPDLEILPLPLAFEVAALFTRHSLGLMLPIGLAMLVGGVWALRAPERGRRALEAAAWFTVLGMVALGVVWSAAVAELGGTWGLHVAGGLLHGVQAAAVLRACLFLRDPRLVRACAPPSSSSSSAS